MKTSEDKTWSAYGLALSLGYMIVVPILVFGIGGVLLDKYLNSFPIFILIGFFLAMTASLMIVYTKTKDIISQGVPKDGPKPKK
jgi:F0F1-type ATP synthase assembly protein I